jgi:copper transport protein
MHPQPLIRWPQPILEFLGFVSAFLAAGAIGFRFVVIRHWLRAHPGTPDDFGHIALRMTRLAARVAVIGAGASLCLLLYDLHARAAERQISFAHALGGNVTTVLQAGLGVLAVVGFSMAALGIGAGWDLAAAGVILGALRPVFLGQWARLINPVHMLAGGMWIGTLFYLVVAGIVPTLRSGLSPERRGAFVMEMVGRFSPFALASAAVLATFGVITAWRHLKSLSALWTTPYGVALIVKLCAVGLVLALGAWNWRRQRPLLGTEGGARSLRRSATLELTAAAIVLVITSVLVSLPSPR